MRKRNVLFSLGASVLLAGAVSAWKTTPSGATGHAGTLSGRSKTGKTETDNAKILPGSGPETAGEHGKAAGLREKEVSPALLLDAAYTDYVQGLYAELGLAQKGLDRGVFNKALTGYYNLKAEGKMPGSKNVLSIVDFTKSSREKRLWIIDLGKKQLLYHTLVAHGQGSGAGKATRFSNTESSHQSSLGFYLTGEVYYGKHGRSLRLDGMDPGFNSNARRRAIVLHGADYVSKAFIDRVGRLGRSYGCPAVPVDLCSDIIDHISEKTVLFIHGPEAAYESDYLNAQTAARYVLTANG